MPRLLAIVLLSASLAHAARAQTLQQYVDKKKAAVMKAIEESKLPDNMKTAFRERLAKAATYSLESEDTALDRLDTDVGNVINTYANWLQVDDYIRTTTGITEKLRNNFRQQSLSLRDTYLPGQYVALYAKVASLKTGLDNYKPLIADIQAFIKKVNENAKAPANLKTKTAGRLQSIIDGMGPSNVVTDWTTFGSEKSRFDGHMIVSGELDKLAQRVAAESPAGYPEFIRNTNAEIDALRRDIGSGNGNTEFSSVSNLSTAFSRRVVLVKLCADVKAKIPKLPAEDRPSFQRKLDELAAAAVDWHGTVSPDEDRIRRLYTNMMERF